MSIVRYEVFDLVGIHPVSWTANVNGKFVLYEDVKRLKQELKKKLCQNPFCSTQGINPFNKVENCTNCDCVNSVFGVEDKK
jgi:hypothetical protein